MEFLKTSRVSAIFYRSLKLSGTPNPEPIILVHGGAGDIKDNSIEAKMRGVKKAAVDGFNILQRTGSAVDAVETAIRSMEDDETFNAGYGSVLNLDGEVEMDASIMVGSNLSSGGVTVIKDIAHPISLARLIMEKTPHVLLAGDGANKFAKEQGISILAPGKLVTTTAKENLKLHSMFHQGDTGTVGAVALGANGHLAAGTSTGGLNGKMVGRSSDSSKIGCGTYADDNIGAISTTGHGESIMKICLAHSIMKAMEQGLTALEATQKYLMYMFLRLNSTAGAVTIARNGDVGIAFSDKRMSWACQRGKKVYYGIDLDQHEEETVS